MKNNSKQSFYEKTKFLRHYVDGQFDSGFEKFICIVIIVNTISLGLETSHNIYTKYEKLLTLIDIICFLIFVFELLLKFVAYNKDFFGVREKNKFNINIWNILDLLIIIFSSFAYFTFFDIFKSLAIFRTLKFFKGIKALRIIKTSKLTIEIKNLRHIFTAIIKSIPGILGTFYLMIIISYIYAVLGVQFFSNEYPAFFGNIGRAFLSLTQIMTHDSWISGIVRPITNDKPFSWIYFISFEFFSAVILLNMITGFLLNSISDARNEKRGKISNEELSNQINSLQAEIQELKKLLKKDLKLDN